jgi:hypothetical protein
MKISLTFDTLQEGLAAINLLTGTANVKVSTEDGDDDTAAPATPGTVDPVLGVELDANGMPWVAEVHAGTKNKNQDGTWKKRKGISDEARAAAEQKALAHLKATSAPGPTPFTAPVGTIVGGGQVAPGIVATPAPVAAPVVAMPGLPVLPAAAALPPISYEQLTEKYAAMAGAGMIDAQRMVTVYTETGVNAAELATNETFRRAVYDALCRIEAGAAAAATGMPGV